MTKTLDFLNKVKNTEFIGEKITQAVPQMEDWVGDGFVCGEDRLSREEVV
jgi:hypothetical protein